ncbi:MAG: helix-turn-helix transcriptional regulator [Desulfobacterales bacterium]|nr:helix-turn-helix transcriptional regulator [Desulfobacterales bacterium]
MKAHGWIKEMLEKAKDTFEYKLEELELNFTEKIIELMNSKNMTRADLANKLNVSKAAVSKLLNNGSNITLKRALSIANALDCNIKIELIDEKRDICYKQNFIYNISTENNKIFIADNYSVFDGVDYVVNEF